MKPKILYLFVFITCWSYVSGQGLNHQWLLGSYHLLQDPKGRMLIDSSGYLIINENRKMPFWGTHGNISDTQGNLLMSSNGVWIANATGDTMLNGSGINPTTITQNWPIALPMTANNLFLPYPEDTSKYIMFHHGATFNGYYYPAYELFSSVIDMTLDNGFGGVVQKNNIVLQDQLNWGIGACKHANSRDWWVVVSKDSSDILFTALVTPTGVQNVSTQALGFLPLPWGQPFQLTFSRDGSKFIMSTYTPNIAIPASEDNSIILLDFNRCTGVFSNAQVIEFTDNLPIWGLSFSPSGKYAYACDSYHIYQIDTDSFTVDTVAVYDGFLSPGPNCCATDFWNMYLAANGKIYVTSGSGVQHIHEINYPDSAGVACDVQQHSIYLGYAQLRAVPNHPNYYLGCDTTLGCTPCLVSIDEINHDFNFNIYPNPSSSNFNIIYLLPQNKEGLLQIFDVTGKIVYEKRLPQWSTLQQISLPTQISSGLYNCVITCGDERVSKKIALLRK